MKLTFCGKSPQQRFFRIGVVGNNLADDLTMIIDKKQGNLNLAEFTPFIKIVNRDFTFVDKTRHFIFDIDTDPEKVRLIYVFPKKVTRQRNVDMQVLFQVTALEQKDGGVTECIDRAHFPDVGVGGVIYIDAATNTPYRYDTATNNYVIIGLDPNDITIINANGGN